MGDQTWSLPQKHTITSNSAHLLTYEPQVLSSGLFPTTLVSDFPNVQQPIIGSKSRRFKILYGIYHSWHLISLDLLDTDQEQESSIGERLLILTQAN
jgi:hypothetical protein